MKPINREHGNWIKEIYIFHLCNIFVLRFTRKNYNILL